MRKKVVTQQPATTIIHRGPATTTNRLHTSAGPRLHRYTTHSPSRIVYHDQPHRISHTHRYDYVFRDSYHRLRHRVVSPRYSYAVGYNHGPYFSLRYVHPYYHRKYLFVSLGGYWPSSYRYRRYAWYGCHPYNWYGYYPLAREVNAGSYNYYTYNYYADDAYQPVQSDVYEQLGEQPPEPDQMTLADTYFEEAVKVFEAGKYDQAAEKFAQAMALAPDDMVLPFAYGQALLANRQYSQAAQVLRTALAKVSPEKDGVFYPRGLYPKEEMLLSQVDDLAEKAELFSSDADLQLLLGYQLLGIGQTDQAVAPLMFASKDLVNTDAAGVLLRLLEKIKTSDDQGKDAGSGPAPDPAPGAAQSNAIIKGDTIRLKEGTLMATLCALGATAGIHHFTHFPKC